MEKFPVFVSKNTFKRHVDLLLIEEEGHLSMFLSKILAHLCTIKQYIVIENMFTTAQILEKHVTDCFGINGKQMIKMTKERETFKFKNYARKTKSPFMIYADFESILVP